MAQAAAEIKENITSFVAYSWTFQDENTTVKALDKSAFLHRGSGIPVEIRPFFMSGIMTPGESRRVVLQHHENEYAAYIEMDHQESPRTRLFWNAEFANMLKTTFPVHWQQYESGELEGSSGLIMRFQRLEGFDKFRIILAGSLKDETLMRDIEAEEIEERGPAKEGAVKEYYGKRYERNPVNRKRAIEIHGLSCNVCGFNFEKTYGERGKDFIEVHHINPISTFDGQEQDVNPRTDLITVCSNCHRMIHRKLGNILSVDELRFLIKQDVVFCY